MAMFVGENWLKQQSGGGRETVLIDIRNTV